MAARSVRRPRRTASQWREILSRYRGSGLSADAFCARESLSKSTFRRWRARLRPTAPTPKADTFVELGVPMPPAEPRSWSVELELPGDIRLRLRG